MTGAIFRSATFQGVLAAAGAFVALSLAVMWLVGLIWIDRIESALRQELDAALLEAREIYLAEGRETVIDELRWDDDQPIWDEEDIFILLEEEELLGVLRDPEGNALVGYPGLYAGDALEVTQLDHAEIEDPVIAGTVELFDDHRITLGRFQPRLIAELQALLSFGSWALVIIVLPLALLTGFFLSRRVFKRLATLAHTTEAVAEGQLTARAPLRGTGDEFDRLADGVNRMLDRLEAMTRNIEAVSVGVAHDLKTPLAHISGRLELIRRDIADPAAVETHVEGAEARLQSLLSVFDALLRLGEIEAGQRRKAFAPVDLSTLAREMADSYAAAFEDAHKTLEAAVLPNLQVSGDRELLAQLIANLLDNALEHSRDAATAHIALMTTEAGLRLEIGDNGPGIPPQMRSRVFERFFRLDASRTTPGHGLGLALVKAIADLHGAVITLREDQPGAVFVILFPSRG